MFDKKIEINTEDFDSIVQGVDRARERSFNNEDNFKELRSAYYTELDCFADYMGSLGVIKAMLSQYSRTLVRDINNLKGIRDTMEAADHSRR